MARYGMTTKELLSLLTIFLILLKNY